MVKDTFCQQYAGCVMSMDNVRKATNKGKQKKVIKTFRIKRLCTALEKNPGIRVEMAVTKGLSRLIIICLNYSTTCGMADN